MQTLPAGPGWREVCDACVTLFKVEPKAIRDFGTEADKRRGAARRALEERRERGAGEEW
jgi:hypothetical protein